MKAKFLSLLVAAMIIFNVSYANTTDNFVNETVMTSFSKQFDNASDVEWTKTANYFKATFNWNGEYLTAFYDDNGESIAVSRNILLKALPLNLQTSLAESYKDYWVTELFEYTTSENSKYYLTIETANKKITLESMDNNYWLVFKKANKE